MNQHIGLANQSWPPIEIKPHNHARNNIRQIVMPARRVINRVPARPSRSTLQCNKLRGQPRTIKQLNPLGVQQRQEIAIQIAFRPSRLLERDPMLGKPSRWPQTRKAVADYPSDTKTPKNRRARGYSNLGIKRRPDFENRIKDTDCAIA